MRPGTMASLSNLAKGNPMRLYHHPLSTCSTRVRMVAHHLGVPLELVAVDLARGEQHGAAFHRLNPNHKVPVLEHDGRVLWESYAIMQYLADLVPGQTLYPHDPAARADVNRWLFWCGQEFMPGVSILNWENSIKSMIGQGTPDGTRVAEGEKLFSSAARVLDEHLAQRTFLCDAGLSLADLAIAAPLADVQRAKLPLAGCEHVQRWLAQVQSLAAWRAVVPSDGPAAPLNGR